MVKVKGVRASGAKAAQKRSELSGQLREVQTAVHRMVTERDKRIEELERKLRLTPPPSPEERAVLDAVNAYFTPARMVIVTQAGLQPDLVELARLVHEWREANGRG